MTTLATAALVRLSDTDLMVADPGEDIRGRHVLDKSGEKLGKVHDLLIDEDEHKVRLMLVEHAGVLGINREKSLIPIDAITRITSDDVYVDLSLHLIAGASDYDPEIINDRAYYTGLYGYYGYAPYWADSYLYPRYPYYL